MRWSSERYNLKKKKRKPFEGRNKHTNADGGYLTPSTSLSSTNIPFLLRRASLSLNACINFLTVRTSPSLVRTNAAFPENSSSSRAFINSLTAPFPSFRYPIAAIMSTPGSPSFKPFSNFSRGITKSCGWKYGSVSYVFAQKTTPVGSRRGGYAHAQGYHSKV